MKHIRYLFIMLIALLAACDYPGDDQSNLVYDDSYHGFGGPVYNGTWSIDGEETNAGELSMDSTLFTLRLMPSEMLLSRLMPERKVENVGYADVMVYYEIVGESDQALYFNIGKTSFRVHAVIDGEERIADIRIGQFMGFNVGGSATYSKLSGVYKFVFPISGCDIYDVEGETLLESVDATAELTFISTKKQT